MEPDLNYILWLDKLDILPPDHPILQIFPKSPKNSIILSPYNNNYYTLTPPL